jgi:chromosome segregation ATPase
MDLRSVAAMAAERSQEGSMGAQNSMKPLDSMKVQAQMSVGKQQQALSGLSPAEVRKERASLERQLHQVLQERKMIQLELESAKDETNLIRNQLWSEKEERRGTMHELVCARMTSRDLCTQVKDQDDERAERQASLQLETGESTLVTRQNETLITEGSALRAQLSMLKKARTLLSNQCGVAEREVGLLTVKVAEVRRETKTIQKEQQGFELEIKHLKSELVGEERERDKLIDKLGFAKDERMQLRIGVSEGKRHQLALASQVTLLESEQNKMNDSIKVSMTEVKYLEG